MDSIYEYIEKNYSAERKSHTEGVVKTAAILAKQYGADPKKAEIAALYHDMYRGVKSEALNIFVKQLGLPDKYLNNPNLAHGKVAAIKMKQDFNVTDTDILNAVGFHTTGRPNMSMLEKVIFLADAIEPGRSYPGVEEVRLMAKEDIDKACLLCLERTVNYIQQRGDYLDPDTLDARDWFQKKEKINE